MSDPQLPANPPDASPSAEPLPALTVMGYADADSDDQPARNARIRFCRRGLLLLMIVELSPLFMCTEVIPMPAMRVGMFDAFDLIIPCIVISTSFGISTLIILMLRAMREDFDAVGEGILSLLPLFNLWVAYRQLRAAGRFLATNARL